MATSVINWDKFNPILKSKYGGKVNQDDGIFKFHLLNVENLDWISDENIITHSYGIFTEQVNELQLSINLFENLLMFEDLRYEQEGVGDFPIDMPREYFRFPALNNPRDIFSQKEFLENEKNIIDNIITKAQQKMNIRNDENIAREYIVKLEFLSLFSIFEAYLENYYVEYLSKNNSNENDEINLKKAGDLIRNKSLDESLKEIIKNVNPEITNLLCGLKNDMFDFIYFSYIVRNIHTHKLGKATNKFIEQGTKKNIIKEYIHKNGEGKIIEQYLYVDCLLGGHKIIKKDKYVSLTEIVSLFRSYTNEIAYILDQSF